MSLRASCLVVSSLVLAQLAHAAPGCDAGLEECREQVALATRRCDSGEPELCADLALLLWRRALPELRDVPRAWNLYRAACERGVGWACKDAATMVGQGEGVARDATEAYELNRRACHDLRNHHACVNLAQQQLEGRGTVADPDAARRLLDQACGAGNLRACSHRGWWAELGTATRPDPVMAATLYLKACRGGRRWACTALGRVVREGTAPPPETSNVLAARCRGGITQACTMLAVLDENGAIDGGGRAKQVRTSPGWAAQGCQAWHEPACRLLLEQTEDPVLKAQLRVVVATEEREAWPERPPMAEVPAVPAHCVERYARRYGAPDLGGRLAGQEGWGKAVARLQSDLAAQGFQVRLDPLPDEKAVNVVGRWAGRGALADEVVVLGGHLDHLGTDEDGVVFPGADDNASGVAGMLCAAAAVRRALVSAGDRRTLLVVGFAAEEQGMIGSTHFVRHHPTRDALAAMVNLDMIGRPIDERLWVDSAAVGWEPLVGAASAAVGLRNAWNTPPGRSDHAVFEAHGVPAVHLTTGVHGDWHRPSDRLAGLDIEGLARVSRVAAGVTARLLLDPMSVALPKSACSPPRLEVLRGFDLGIGLAPEDLRLHQSDRFEEVPVRCVVPGGAGDVLGLRAGDRIVDATPLTGWVRGSVEVQVERDGACVMLAAGREPMACPP